MFQCDVCKGISEIDMDAAFLKRGVCTDCENEMLARMHGAVAVWEVE